MSNISAPFHGLSTEFHKTAASGGALSNSTKVGEVASIGALELSANIIEYNAYGQNFKRKLSGQKDSGTLALTLNWTPTATSSDLQTTLKTAYEAGTSGFYSIKWVSGSENARASFAGFISSFSIESPIEDVVTCNIELSIDGAVTFALDTV